MKKLIFIMLTLLLGFAAMSFAAGGHGHGAAEKPHSDHSAHSSGSKDAHAGMAMSAGMVMLGNQVNQGVKGMAHLNDVREAMAKAGMKATHHFMIAFADEKTGVQIEQGTVALKLIDPNGKVMDTVELVGMEGHFGADIVLDLEGEYHFKLGTELNDGRNRKYHFHHEIK